eukprot:4074061-Karenia_brevis.AAC.1
MMNRSPASRPGTARTGQGKPKDGEPEPRTQEGGERKPQTPTEEGEGQGGPTEKGKGRQIATKINTDSRTLEIPAP